MNLAFLHYIKSSPLSNDLEEEQNSVLTTGHICFYTMASNLSSPGASHNFAAKTLRPTSSIVRGGIDTAVHCGRGPSSSILAGSRGRTPITAPRLVPLCPFMVDPSRLVTGS